MQSLPEDDAGLQPGRSVLPNDGLDFPIPNEIAQRGSQSGSTQLGRMPPRDELGGRPDWSLPMFRIYRRCPSFNGERRWHAREGRIEFPAKVGCGECRPPTERANCSNAGEIRATTNAARSRNRWPRAWFQTAAGQASCSSILSAGFRGASACCGQRAYGAGRGCAAVALPAGRGRKCRGAVTRP